MHPLRKMCTGMSFWNSRSRATRCSDRTQTSRIMYSLRTLRCCMSDRFCHSQPISCWQGSSDRLYPDAHSGTSFASMSRSPVQSCNHFSPCSSGNVRSNSWSSTSCSYCKQFATGVIYRSDRSAKITCSEWIYFEDFWQSVQKTD